MEARHHGRVVRYAQLHSEMQHLNPQRGRGRDAPVSSTRLSRLGSVAPANGRPLPEQILGESHMCIGCEQTKSELKWACYQNDPTKTICHACTIKLAVTSIHSVLERYTLPNDFMPVFCPHCCSLRWKGEKCHGEPVLGQGHFPAETVTVCGQPDCGELKTRHNLGRHLKESCYYRRCHGGFKKGWHGNSRSSPTSHVPGSILVSASPFPQRASCFVLHGCTSRGNNAS